MADYDASAVETLLSAAEDRDHELIQHLRGALKGKYEGSTDSSSGSMSDADMQELAGYRRAAQYEGLFKEAGIGTEGTDRLLRDTLSTREGLTLESIKAEAAKYGITPQEPTQEPNPATPEEIAAHQEVQDVAGEPPAVPPGIEERIANAKTEEELNALVAEAGLQWTGNKGIDLLS